MVDLAAFRVVLTAVLVVGALSATGASPTQSQFADGQPGTSNVTAADDFKKGFPSDAVAYDDANGNSQYDGGEATYTASDLSNLTDSTVDLRFHSDANTITTGNSSIDVANISTETGVKFETGTLDWAVADTMEIEDTTLRANSVTLTADNGDVLAAGVTAKKTTSIRITAHRGDVDLSNGDLRADNSIQVYALSGRIDVTGAKCQAPTEDLQDSTGQVNC